ncbi:MAG: hypothetical protein O7C75_12475 [Verrucomicrobia bacterium]|nr:hypothetical protein [Verrucomicrobiota bacterium]
MKLGAILNKFKFEHGSIDRHSNILPYLLVFVAGLFYVLAWNSAPIAVNDSGGYMKVAADLQDLKLDTLHGRTPGYPLLLWLTNSSEQPTRLLFFTQLLLHFTSVLLLAYLLNYMAVSKKIIALFLFIAVIPPSMVMTAYVLTETLTQFFLVAGFVFLLLGLDKSNTTLVVISSIALSLAGFVRPTYELIFIPVLGMLLVALCLTRKSRGLLILATFSTFAFSTIFIGGLIWHNYSNFNYSKLTPFFGYGLSSKTARFLERLPDEYTEVRETLIRNRDRERVTYRTAWLRRPWHNSSHNGLYYIWLARPELRKITNLSNLELSDYMLRLNLLLIRKAPLQYLREVVVALPTYWLPITTDLSNFNSKTLQLLWAGIHFVVMVLFFSIVPILLGSGLFLFKLPVSLREKFRSRMAMNTPLFLLSSLLAFAIIGYTMLISVAADVGNPRHRVPTDLLIFFVIALGIHCWLHLRDNLLEKKHLPVRDSNLVEF